MDRIEARNRIDAAVAFLKVSGYTRKEIERLLDGLHREDAVEVAELRVKWIKRGSPTGDEV